MLKNFSKLISNVSIVFSLKVLRDVQRKFQAQDQKYSSVVEAIDIVPDQAAMDSICEQSTSPLTTIKCTGSITPISSELSTSKEQCQKLRDSLRKGKLSRRKLKLKVQQLENTNKCLMNVSVSGKFLYATNARNGSFSNHAC